MKLLQGEQMLMESSGKVLTLTTARVRYEATERGRSKVVSMTLDAVASCGLATRSFPVLLALAAFSAVVGVAFVFRGSDGSFLFFLAAIVLGVAYLLTRTAVLEVSSAGESIMVPTKGMSRDTLMEFVDAVDVAKHKYLTARAGQ
jgi:Na+-transporting methylmalonyl-CoA/oxaloacetate decarboxylase gamma subunit